MFDEWDVVGTRPDPRPPIDPWEVVSTRADPRLVPDAEADIRNATITAGIVGAHLGQQMMQSAIPHELRGYTPEELQRPTQFINPRSGQQSDLAGTLARTPLDIPAQGAGQIVDGIEQTASPDIRRKAGGASKIIQGSLELASPAVPGAIAAAPLATLAGLGTASLAQTGTEKGLNAVGVPPEYSGLAGDVTGLVAGGLASHGISRVGDMVRSGEDLTSRIPTSEKGGWDVVSERPAVSAKLEPEENPRSALPQNQANGGWEVASITADTKAVPNSESNLKTETSADPLPQTGSAEYRKLPFSKRRATDKAADLPTPSSTTEIADSPTTNLPGQAEVVPTVDPSEMDRAGPAQMHRLKDGAPGITLEESNSFNSRERAIVYRDESGRPQGYLSFYLDDAHRGVAPPEHGALPEVYVSPVARRNGIATRLYDEADRLGYDLSAVSGKQTTPDGAEFLNARAKNKAAPVGELPPVTNEGMETLASGPAGLIADFLKSNDGPKENYSGMGALKDKFVRNGSQLEDADPEAYQAFASAASSKAKAAALIKTAEPQLADALGRGGPSLDDFKKTLIESRLQGTQQRWLDLASEAQKVPDDQLVDWASNGPLQILAHMGDKDGGGRAQTAAALAEKAAQYRDNIASLRPDQVNPKAPETLRNYIADAFNEAAGSVKHLMESDDFRAQASDPGFQRALKVYKDQYEKPMSQSHGENEGVFSNALGPLDTYYPLVAANADRPASGIMRALPFKRPRNISNGFTTGLSEDYDASVAAFKDRLSGAFRTNDRAAMLDTLRQQGLIRPVKPGAPADVFNYKGKDFTAQAVQTTLPRTVYQDGKVINMPGKTEVMPSWLHRELQPLLDSGKRPAPSALNKIVDAVNKLSLAGGADVVYHAHNLLGALVANTPFLGSDLAAKTIGNLPFTKIFTAIAKVAMTDPMSKVSAGKLQELAQIGALPEKYASATYSKLFAEQTGAEHEPFSAAPLLYGPKGIDVRARLAMYDAAKAINPNVKGAELAKFVNQLGNYTHALQGSIERRAKSTGLSPFFTAGRQMIQNGVNAWLGTGPKAGGGSSSVIAQQLSGGAVGLVGSWVAAYRAYTGKYPWEDPRAQLLKIPLNPKDRTSAIAKAMYGKDAMDPRKDVYVNFGFFSPSVARGARALGLSGSFRAGVEHGSPAQMMEGGVRDVANSAIHPFTGPLPRTAFVTATGKQPYLVGDSDAGGSKFMSAIDKHAPIGSEILQGLKQVNSMSGGLSDLTGFGSDKSDGNRWLKAILDMTGLSGGSANPYAAEQALRTERYVRHGN